MGRFRTAPLTHEAHPTELRRRAIVTWLALGLLISGMGWLALRDHRYRHVRAQLDEAVRLADAGKLAESLTLALEVEKALPSSPALERLWPEISRVLEVETQPPGAKVSVRLYGAGDGTWCELGVTPFTGARIPILPTQLRLSKPGYVTADRALWRYGPPQIQLAATLLAEGKVPEGMVAIPGGDLPRLELVGMENVHPGDVPPAFVAPVEASQQPLFRSLGVPIQDKRHVITEGGHSPPQDLQVRETIDWLDQYLGPARPAVTPSR